MAADPKVTIKSLLSEIDRIVLILAVAVLIAAVASFLVVATVFHSSNWRDLVLTVISSVVANVIIYLAVYVSLSRVVNTRREVDRQELVDSIVSGLSSKQALQYTAENISSDQPRHGHISQGRIGPEQRRLVQRFLEAAYLLVVALTRNHDIRIYCHVADTEDGLLYPTNIMSVHRDDEYGVAIPFRGQDSQPFIIAEALTKGQIVGKDLPPNHREQYPPELRLRIRSQLRCVIAVPIMEYDPGVHETNPVGTVSLDCDSASLKQLGMVDDDGAVVDEINDILKSCASVIHLILTYA